MKWRRTIICSILHLEMKREVVWNSYKLFAVFYIQNRKREVEELKNLGEFNLVNTTDECLYLVSCLFPKILMTFE